MKLSTRHFVCYGLTDFNYVSGSCASLVLFACSKSWLLQFYQFLFGLLVLFLSTMLQTILVASSYKDYHLSHPHMNESVFYSVVASTLEHRRLNESEVSPMRVLITFIAS